MVDDRLRIGQALTRIEGVVLAATSEPVDLIVRDGVVAEIESSSRAPQSLALPAFSDLHVHADRAFARAPRTASSLKDGVELVQAVRARFTEEDVCSRATRLFTRALSRGVLNIRSHVDVDHVVEGRSLAGVLRARDRFRHDLRVVIIAFANARLDPSSSDGDRRLRDAVERGATFVGGAVNFHPDPRKSIDTLLDLAVELGVDVDLHIDETTDPDDFNLEYLAESTIEHGLSGRVTASHACALAYVPAAVAKRTIDRVREARITIIANPATNLFVMGRGNGTPRQRGITLVKELTEAGVPVRFASDSASDVFYPYGSSDPLEIAFLAGLAAQLDDERILLAGIADGRSDISAGDSADLVLVDAESFSDAVARRPARVVIRAGVVVGTDRP